MVDLRDIKLKLASHKNTQADWMFTNSSYVAYEFMVICEQLVNEIESLRKDLAEMYGVTKHVHKR